MITHDNWPERWEDLPAGTEISGEIYDQMFNALPPISLRKSPTIPFNDSELERLWELFGDVPINNDDEIEEDFIDFPAGTYRFEIWHWFDELYSKGVKALTEVS